MSGLIIGIASFFAGSTFTVVIMSMMYAASEADDLMERYSGAGPDSGSGTDTGKGAAKDPAESAEEQEREPDGKTPK